MQERRWKKMCNCKKIFHPEPTGWNIDDAKAKYGVCVDCGAIQHPGTKYGCYGRIDIFGDWVPYHSCDCDYCKGDIDPLYYV
ncbi:MAG: hypothetical protein D6707_09290 [Bacteroidetes bacterium]|nr:MAG: hypothetical protein D6707_09290 [Bacteroidota bacterium]